MVLEAITAQTGHCLTSCDAALRPPIADIDDRHSIGAVLIG